MMRIQSKLFFDNLSFKNRNNIILITDSVPLASKINETLKLNERFFFFSIVIENKNQDISELNNYCLEKDGFAIHDLNPEASVIETCLLILTHFTKGLKITKPIWSQIYNDAFGWGKLVAVTMPIYDSNNDLVGVSAIDVPVAYINSDFGIEEKEIEYLLVKRENY